jgi:hypothetical protein
MACGCTNTTYSGFSTDSALGYQLDAGAYFVNFDIATDTYATAKAAGKLLGATQGGGSFTATPEMRTINVDGVKGAAKGNQVIDSWDVMMSPTVLELSKELMAYALATSTNTEEAFYNKIQANNYICDDDYLTNITFVGRLSGTQKPIIIQIFNAVNTNGITLESADNSEGTIAMEFKGHYDASDLDSPPFAIYFPKAEGTISGTVEDAATPVEGATVTVTIDGEDLTATTAADGTFTICNVPYGTGYTVTATKDAKTGTATDLTVVAGQDTDAGTIAIV